EPLQRRPEPRHLHDVTPRRASPGAPTAFPLRGEMLSFKDTEGRTWTVRLTAYAVARVRERTGLDLFAVLDGWPEPAGKLSGDPALFLTAVYLLATAQKGAPAGVSDEDFLRAVDGEVLDAMSDAFHEAVLDFFRRSPRGPALAKVREKARELERML